MLSALLGLMVFVNCCADDFDPYKGPQPLLVFTQTNPWLMVIGSDTPRVAVYEDGQAIFVKRIDERLEYHSTVLDKEQLEGIRKRMEPVLALKGVAAQYNMKPNATDQPEAVFYLRAGDRQVVTSVYGLMSPGTRLPGYTEFPGGPEPTIPPTELLDLHKWLSEFDFQESRKWVPAYVEVMLWDYSYAPDQSIHWPAEWPGLESDRTIKRGDAYSIFLDGTELPKLDELLRRQKDRGAVEVEGRKMAVSYRYVFPSEPVWRKALAEARK